MASPWCRAWPGRPIPAAWPGLSLHVQHGGILARQILLAQRTWAAVPFMKGYVRKITLTGDERDRLGGLLFSRQLIDLVFRVCRDPESAVSRAKRLPAMHRDCEAKARDILAVCPLP
jgi:hypothetical protein